MKTYPKHGLSKASSGIAPLQLSEAVAKLRRSLQKGKFDPHALPMELIPHTALIELRARSRDEIESRYWAKLFERDGGYWALQSLHLNYLIQEGKLSVKDADALRSCGPRY